METTRNIKGFERVATLAMNSDKADSVKEACRGREAILEAKYDGIRLLVHRTEDGVEMYARSGNSKSGRLPAIDAEILRNLPAGTWLDGEAVSFNPDGTQDWGGAQSCLGSGATKGALKSESIRFVVFDILAHGGLDARSLPLRNRRELLEMVFEGADFERVMLSPWMEATEENHDANLEAGFEGSMVKVLDAPYQSGKRVKTSTKIKMTDTVDGVITGFSPGKPDSWIAAAGLVGTIDFVHWHNGEKIEGRCSGMTVAVREDITRNQASLIGTVVEVGYMTRMPGGKIRHPQFKRLRDDKTAEECRA